MKYGIYTIKDLKAGFSNSVTVQLNDEVAIRNFKEASSDPSSLLCKCKADFELWKLGTYDTKHGTITGEPEFIFSMVGEN